jgi:TctA family transporter
MGDFVSNLALGLGVACKPVNLGFAFIGCLLGTLIGVLPGLGPIATLAMLLPLTFYLSPETALIMLAGIYYGAQYGGSTTAILVNLPGESSSVVTCLDGYQMARQGRAGSALATAALASFFAGTVATLAISIAAPPLTAVAHSFGPSEYFSLMVLGLIAAVILAQGSVLKATAMMVLGLLMGLVGTDVTTGGTRFTFGSTDLNDGIDFVCLAVGLFGLSEVIKNLSEGDNDRSVTTQGLSSLYPSREEFRAAFPAAMRGTALGMILGVLPGGGAILSSFSAYVLEKRIARDPARFGRGAIEGVAAPEAANNAGAQAAFIPMLTLGIPPNAVMAVMVGALMIHGIQPGPGVMTQRPDLFWGLIASMWIGNVMLLVINLPLIGIWVRLLMIPYRMLFAAIMMFCAIGVFSVSNSAFEVVLAAFFGGVGYIFIKLGCEIAPLILGFVLGPMLEENLRRSLLITDGDFSVFVTRPISLTLLLIAVGLLLATALPAIQARRAEAFSE